MRVIGGEFRAVELRPAEQVEVPRPREDQGRDDHTLREAKRCPCDDDEVQSHHGAAGAVSQRRGGGHRGPAL